METECQLDVPVTKLSVLSGSQIHHVGMGTDPRQQKPTIPQIHTNMQINNKINITPQTSHPSMTSFWRAQHQNGGANQPRRQMEWLNAILSFSLLPPSYTVSFVYCLLYFNILPQQNYYKLKHFFCLHLYFRWSGFKWLSKASILH